MKPCPPKTPIGCVIAIGRLQLLEIFVSLYQVILSVCIASNASQVETQESLSKLQQSASCLAVHVSTKDATYTSP